MSNLFTNKVVVITGASSGIGRATAYEFGRLGAKCCSCCPIGIET
jgi:NAD(P)-dependent dehydrogenase (short-subunit alcohol dehydrogenase family)